jgi:hypothetical protein
MEGFCAKRTARHLLEPIGYGLLRKTVARGVLANSGVDQYQIHSIASDFRSSWIRVLPPHSLDSPHSYTMPECVDCDAIPDALIPELCARCSDLNNDYIAYKIYMMNEGYFVRGSRFLRQRTTFTQPPLYLVDFSLYGVIQGNCVRFPDLPWTYTIFQAELLYG